MITNFRKCGAISLNIREAGPADGPLVVLLHGFPDFSFGWHLQMPALAAAGFHVVAPDQRGYNLSDKPQGVEAYDLDRLAEDVIGLAASYGSCRFSVVGHDWGASVAWWLASNYPDHVASAAMINAPHPAIWRDAMRHDPRQRYLSSYVKFLALPWLPEKLLAARDFLALFSSLRTSKAELPEWASAFYRAAWSRPGALTAMVNWYRALLKRRFVVPAPASIRVPVRVIWGQQDPYAIPELADRSAALCANAKIAFLDEATHWAMWDEPARVNELLIGLLSEARIAEMQG